MLETLKDFIVFEGLDGSGTTTQARLLEQSLAAQGRQVEFTGEPTDNPIGRLLRQALSGSAPLCRSSIAYLFAADRNQHLHAPDSGILAAVSAGRVVLCDRYIFSSLAYQSIDCPEELIARLNADFPLPRLLIYLDVPVEVCLERIRGRTRKEIFEYREFQQKAKLGYERVVESYRRRGLDVLAVDGNRPPGLIHAEIHAAAAARISV